MFGCFAQEVNVNNFHERTLRVVYDDHNSSYSQLLITKNVRAIYQQNINDLLKEIYKFENDLSPPLIDDMFQVRKINYNLRHFQKIANTKKKLRKNWSRDNTLSCTSIMELSSNRD